MRRRSLTTLGLLLVATSAAHAQTEEDYKTSIDLDQTAIGIDNCSLWTNTAFAVDGLLDRTGETQDFELTLGWSTGEMCSREQLLDCPLVVQGASPECGCLDQETGLGTTLRREGVTLVNLLEMDPCSADRPYDAVNFYLRFYQSTDGSDTTTNDVGFATTIDFDFTRPPAPTQAPALSNADAALRVTVADVDSNDVARYEVCYRPATGVSDDADGGAAANDGTMSNDDLRAGFSACTSVSRGDPKARIEGLENDTVYEVVYATFDAAENRSANSPIARGTPAEVLDFAEYYHSVNGAETGGCAQGGEGPVGPLLLFVGLLGLVRLRSHA